MRKIQITNLKSINTIEFEVPSSGIHILTGVNGSGKTSLLVALNRIGNKRAFDHFRVGREVNIDRFEKTEIKYSVNDKEITYYRSNRGWESKPRGNTVDLQRVFGFTSSYFISTSGIRFYQTEFKDLQIRGKRITFSDVPLQLKTAMNQIFDTDKFSDLKYGTIKNKKGRQRILHRNNILYAIVGSETYSEMNFSLGERLILNTLDYINDISSKALLIIDEIELALHPTAQVRFYNHLKKLSEEKELTCIISTHSSSLIKCADKRIFLENENGTVKVLTDCYPSYILKELTVQQDNNSDYLFFVEDIMATRYLNEVLRVYQKTEDKHVSINIVPVGGYEQVVKMAMSFYSIPPYSQQKVQAFLDNDVQDTWTELQGKSERTDAEQRKLELLNGNKSNISFLSITPELGVWKWLKSDSTPFMNSITEHYGTQLWKMKDVIDKVEAEETGAGRNERDHAKGCLKNLREKLISNIHLATEETILNLLFESYVTTKYDNEGGMGHLKRVIKPILRRK